MAKIKELQVKEEPAATLGRNEIESALAKIEEVQALLSKYSDKLNLIIRHLYKQHNNRLN